jgi:hypothetical protein
MLDGIMPYLDRCLWNSCSFICKEINNSSITSSFWPQKRFVQEQVHAIRFPPFGVYLDVGGDSPSFKILLYHIRRELVDVLSTEKFQLDIMERASEECLVCADFENVQVWNTQSYEVSQMVSIY